VKWGTRGKEKEKGKEEGDVCCVVRADAVPLTKVGDAEIRWVINHASGGAKELTVGLTTMKPGGRNPLHIHPNCEEVLHLLHGSIDHIIENDKGELVTMHMDTGDTVVVPRGKKHQAINTGDYAARWIVTFSSAHRETVYCT